MSKYQFTDKMGELSGFGGGYEAACRRMVIKGVEWLDEHKHADLSVSALKNTFGFVSPDSSDAKDLEKAFTKDEDDLTGAMVHQAWLHLLFIQKNGWKKYVEKMEEPDEKSATPTKEAGTTSSRQEEGVGTVRNTVKSE